MRCLLFIWLLFGAVQSYAIDRFSVEGYQLPNGLQLILKPSNDRDHVSIRLVVGVGLDDFNCADQQLPHLLEHLLFSGIDDTGEGGLEERMQALGGEWNAFTSHADTTFVIEAPAKNQRKVLDLLISLITQTQLTEARINEAKQVVEREGGGHYSHLQRWLDRQDLGHNASNQLAIELGLKCAERAPVNSLTREQLESVRTRWYAPNNMTLIIVGELDRLLPAYLERTYGALEPVEPSEHKPLAAIEAKADAERVLIRGVVGNTAKLHWLMPEPVIKGQRDETWDLLRDYLEWAVYSELRLKNSLSYGPWSEREVFGGVGFLSLNADLERDDVDKAQQVIAQLKAKLLKDGLDPHRFARLKKAAVERQKWAAQGNSALADYYWSALGDYESGRFADPAKRLQAVSVEQANHAMRQLFAEPGYVRIEKPLFSYNSLSVAILAALTLLLLIVLGWRVWRHRHR